MKEIWKDIKNFDGYQVSNLGRIKSLTRKGRLNEKILKQGDHRQGYKYVVLCKNYKSHPLYLHRLVATTFISNKNNKPDVNHINGQKDDNQITNLEWVTKSENTKHAYNNGLMGDNSGENCSNAKLVNKHVKDVRFLLKCSNLSQRKIGNIYKVDRKTISDIKLSKTWSKI